MTPADRSHPDHRHLDDAVPAAPLGADASPAWVAIRALGPRHRQRIREHLLALSPQDRYLRFGYPASNDHVGHYADALAFDHDEVFGLFDRQLRLVAMAHLAYVGSPGSAPVMAEFGVSVLPDGRGRGLGTRLFEHACLHARNRGIDTMVVHALSENLPMLRIAKAAGALLVRDGPESTATLRLPPDDLGSHLSQLVVDQAAELDYGLKRHALQLDRLVRHITGRGEPAR